LKIIFPSSPPNFYFTQPIYKTNSLSYLIAQIMVPFQSPGFVLPTSAFAIPGKVFIFFPPPAPPRLIGQTCPSWAATGFVLIFPSSPYCFPHPPRCPPPFLSQSIPYQTYCVTQLFFVCLKSRSVLCQTITGFLAFTVRLHPVFLDLPFYHFPNFSPSSFFLAGSFRFLFQALVSFFLLQIVRAQSPPNTMLFIGIFVQWVMPVIFPSQCMSHLNFFFFFPKFFSAAVAAFLSSTVENLCKRAFPPFHFPPTLLLVPCFFFSLRPLPLYPSRSL